VVEPELFASLRPPTYSGGFGIAGGLAGGGAMPPPGTPAAETALFLAQGKRPQEAQQELARAAHGRVLAGEGGANAPPVALDEEKLELGQSVASAASASKLGDYFQYAIDHPVTLPRQKSALLPILGKDVEGERVSIYNERTHAKFPLLGLAFTN